MDKELIDKINAREDVPYEQGIYYQPFGVPDDIKEYVIYSKYTHGGAKGGSCWGDNAEEYTSEKPENHMAILDIVLEEIAPKITFLMYRKIQRLIQSNKEHTWEYYGNYTDDTIEYLKVSDLENFLKENDII